LEDPAPALLRLVIDTSDGERVFLLEQEGDHWLVIYQDRVYVARAIGSRQRAEKPVRTRKALP